MTYCNNKTNDILSILNKIAKENDLILDITILDGVKLRLNSLETMSATNVNNISIISESISSIIEKNNLLFNEKIEEKLLKDRDVNIEKDNISYSNIDIENIIIKKEN